MTCRECGHRMNVVNVRNAGAEVMRKRVCPACGLVIYTFEAEDETGYAKQQLYTAHRYENLRSAMKRMEKDGKI